MINLEITILCFTLKVDLVYNQPSKLTHLFKHFLKVNADTNADKSADKGKISEKPIYEEFEVYDEEVTETSQVLLQAEQFEKELANIGIYDIPDTSDIAPNFNISDDVEIITDEFEKEMQDLIERRR